MIWLHSLMTKKAREGVYHIRIYTFSDDEAITGLDPEDIVPGRMQAHWQQLIDLKPTYLPQPLAMGDFSSALDSPTEPGSFTNGQWSVTIPSQVYNSKLIAASRDRDAEMWCEVVLEQNVLDCPAPVIGSNFMWPRRERCVFWGKLARIDSDGVASGKAIKERGFAPSITRRTKEHHGSLKLTFANWLQIIGSMPVKGLLDELRGPDLPPDRFISCAEILYAIVRKISPTPLVHISDASLNGYDGLIWDNLYDTTRCNFTLSGIYDGAGAQTQKLAELEVPVRKDGTFRALFENINNQPGPNSLYSKDSVKSLLAAFAAEFGLKWQAELPTLSAAWAAREITDNSRANKQKYFSSTTRWLFALEDQAPMKIYVKPVSPIQYRPSSTWLSKARVDQPGTSNTLPQPLWAEAFNLLEGGQNVSRKVLFRFLGTEIIDGLPNPSSGMGCELYVRNRLTPTIRLAVQSVTEGGVEYTSWARYHAARLMRRWGSFRSTIEFTSQGVGLEPYGAHAKNNFGQVLGEIKPIVQTFGMQDFSEFPLMRSIDDLIGDMGEDDTLIRHIVYDIVRTVNGNTKLKMIEIGTFAEHPGSHFTEQPPVYPPPPPPPKDPPTTTFKTPTGGATVLGTIPVQVYATDSFGVAQVKFFANGGLIDTSVVPVPSTAGEYHFTLNTLLFAEGPLTLKAEATDIFGNTSSTTISVTVDNVPPLPP